MRTGRRRSEAMQRARTRARTAKDDGENEYGILRMCRVSLRIYMMNLPSVLRKVV